VHKLIWIIIYLILLAAIHSKFELMIEGKKAGWALRLPCWRINNQLTQFLCGKEITGYHVWLLILFWLVKYYFGSDKSNSHYSLP
jgi:hypothetical protein